ncbi:MAG: histidine phosphatase family protein [Thermodesulfobacteriota bacterium]
MSIAAGADIAVLMRRTRLPESATHLVLVRHGAVHNPKNVLYGRLPRFPLAAAGRSQALAAALALAATPLAALYSSPLLRARQTAAAIRERQPGLSLALCHLLTDVASPHQGRPGAEVDALPDNVYQDSRPPFETPADVLGRLIRFLGQVRRRHSGQWVAAVSHGDPIAFLILWAHGQPPSAAGKTGLAPWGIPGGYPGPGSITTLTLPVEGEVTPLAVHHQRPG